MNKHNFKMMYTDGALTRIELPNGYVSPEGIRYYIKDNQGNIRQVVDSVGTVLQENHYYPYGMLMGESSDIINTNRLGQWSDGVSNQYRFGGNRLLTLRNAQIGDFNARWYDFQTCRFLQQDPFREKYYPYCPYLYCLANPVIFTDPKGLYVVAKEIDVQEMIKNTLPKEANEYVIFNENGVLDAQTLSMYANESESQNLSDLLEMASNEEYTFEVYLADFLSYISSDGFLKKQA